MLTYKQALRAVVAGHFRALAHRPTWRDIGFGLLAVVTTVVRLSIILLFPISTPLIAWLLMVDERKRAEQEVDIRARLRRGMHQNGPGSGY